jgi:hypothetical protein
VSGLVPGVEEPVRAAVRLAFRAHICGLVPASNVNWLADLAAEGVAFLEPRSS